MRLEAERSMRRERELALLRRIVVEAVHICVPAVETLRALSLARMMVAPYHVARQAQVLGADRSERRRRQWRSGPNEGHDNPDRKRKAPLLGAGPVMRDWGICMGCLRAIR
jgi:uncharacterized protein YqiB (DUF1249 family)